MGSLPRLKPNRLAKKLLHIRQQLALSQNEMVRRLGFVQLVRSNISSYERGVREPPLPILLAYARAAGTCVDVLIDDKLKLPNVLGAEPAHCLAPVSADRINKKV